MHCWFSSFQGNIFSYPLTKSQKYMHTVVSEILSSRCYGTTGLTLLVRIWGRVMCAEEAELAVPLAHCNRKFFPVWSYCLCWQDVTAWDVGHVWRSGCVLLELDYFILISVHDAEQNQFNLCTRKKQLILWSFFGHCCCMCLIDFFPNHIISPQHVQCDLWLQGQRSAHTHLWFISAH